MKGSIVTSAVLHGLALTFALVSLGSPASFDVADVEALPVDIVPISEMTQIQQGDQKAPLAEKASPIPSEKPSVENAENAGENEIDLKTPPKPTVKPVETETASAPKPTEKAEPTPEPVKEEVKEPVEEKPPAEPATEVAALPEASAEVKPDPKPEPEPAPAEEKAAENPDAEALPDKVPTPMVKPKVEQPAQTAKTPDRKTEEAKKPQKKAASQKEGDSVLDDVAMLLNKQDSSGGGAKRGKEPAAFGGKKTTTGNTLSMSEMDALKGQIQKNWSIVPGMAGMDGMVITVTMQLDTSGMIVGVPEVEAQGGSDAARRAMMGSALRAVRRSQPYQLPPDKYDSWSEVVVNFDPSDMIF